MKKIEVGTKIGDDVVESVTITTRPSEDKLERIKKEIENEDYTLIIKSFNNGEEFTLGWRFTVVDKDINKPLQFGDYIKCSAEELHECIDLMIAQCKEAKQMVESKA